MTEKPHISDYLNFGLLIAGNAGKIMRDYFEKSSISSTYKEDETIVTIADKEINTPAILVIGNVIDVFKEIKGID